MILGKDLNLDQEFLMLQFQSQQFNGYVFASKKCYNPYKRCCVFFQSLYNSLRMGGRAVLQFYPDGNQQIEMITNAAMKSGFFWWINS